METKFSTVYDGKTFKYRDGKVMTIIGGIILPLSDAFECQDNSTGEIIFISYNTVLGYLKEEYLKCQ